MEPDYVTCFYVNTCVGNIKHVRHDCEAATKDGAAGRRFCARVFDVCRRYSLAETPTETKKYNDTIEGIDGLNEGEVVALPELKTLNGEPAALAGVKTEKFLFVFFTPACPGCSLTRRSGRV